MDWKFWAIIIVLAFFSFAINFWLPSKGTHTGIVTAVEDNWHIWTTTLVYFKTNPMSSQENRYCVVDPVIKAKLQNYQLNQTRVTIFYENGFFVPKWVCNAGETIITDVIVV